MAAKLVAEEGTLKGLVLSLEDSDHWVIGRDPDACQLLIEDPSASRRHLICRTTPKGILLENLSTTNPVQVNDVEVKDPTLLKNGDAVKIGSGGIFRFYSEAAAHLFEESTTKEPEEIGSDAENAPAETQAGEKTPEEGTAEKEKWEKPEQEPEKEASTNVGVEDKDAKEHNDVQKQETNAETVMESQESDQGTPEEATEHPETPEKEQPAAADESVTAVATEKPAETPQEPPAEEEEKHDTIYDEEPAEKSQIAEINFGLLDAGRWLLKVIAGPNNGAEFPMQTGTSYSIGTDPYACDIVFHDTSVSRQHARVSVGPDDTLQIEDLKSRNKTLVDGEPLQGKIALKPNSIVTMGTTSFVVFDREGEMQTIVAPLFPTAAKAPEPVEPPKKSEEEIKLEQQQAALAHQKSLEAEAANKQKAASDHHTTLGAFILIAILTSILIVVGIGTATLFKSEPIAQAEAIDYTTVLDNALASTPTVKYSFNKTTGQLLLVGHVLTQQDKSQLLYGLQGLKFIKSVDDSGLVIDEGVWRETNQILEKNPEWKGINIISSSPGQFVLSGYMRTRAQAEKLSDYLSNNFPYPDLLEKRIIVDEDILASTNVILKNHGIKNTELHLENGELTIGGAIPQGSSKALAQSLKEIQEIRGIRTVFNQTTELAPEQDIINISDRYEVTGVSTRGNNMSVVINGRILMKGDILDGMTVTEIQPTTIHLEKDNVKYRIDFKR